MVTILGSNGSSLQAKSLVLRKRRFIDFNGWAPNTLLTRQELWLSEWVHVCLPNAHLPSPTMTWHVSPPSVAYFLVPCLSITSSTYLLSQEEKASPHRSYAGERERLPHDTAASLPEHATPDEGGLNFFPRGGRVVADGSLGVYHATWPYHLVQDDTQKCLFLSGRSLGRYVSRYTQRGE